MPPPGQTQRAKSHFIVFENFERLNTAEDRRGLKESEFAWVENLQPIASNNWTTVPGQGQAITSLGVTFTETFFGVLNGVDYIVGFDTTGAAYAVNVATGAVNPFAPSGTFSQSPDMTSWEGQRFLFNDSVAGYCSWDGVTFTRQGGVSSNIIITNGGSGYTTAPAVTISGGSGTGATATSAIASPGVVQVILDNGGSGYTSNPSIAFSTGAAAANVSGVDPRGVNSMTVTGPNFGGTYTPHIATGAAPSVIVSFTGGGGGLGANWVANMTVDNLGFSHVSSFSVVAQGSGYTSAPGVVLTPGPNTDVTTTANATCTVGIGNVLAPIIVTNPGTYTTTPNVSFSGGGGLGAAAHAVLGGGGVTSITLTNPGHGFSPGDTLTVAIAPVSTFTATIAATTMTVSASTTGPILAGQAVQGAGVTAGTFIVSQLTGPPGGTGTYQISPSQTVGAPTAMTGGATATAHVAPVIPAGTSVAVFGGRVWLNFFTNTTPGVPGSGQLTGLQWSGVNGWDDWSVANASGSEILPDTDLVHQITGLRSFNNFLWIIGDQSIKQIGNISLNQAGNVTLFTILTLSSDQGTTYLRSCISYNRVFFFATQKGVYAVFGSSVQKISGDLDGIFESCLFPPVAQGLQPQGSLVDMNNIHCVMWLLKINDTQVTASIRSIFVIFDGKRWFLGSQGAGIRTVTHTCSVGSPNWVPYASSGGDLTPIFNAQTTKVSFFVITALSHHGNPVQRKKTIRLGYATSLVPVQPIATVNGLLQSDENQWPFSMFPGSGGFQTFTFATDPGVVHPDPSGAGTYLGFALNGTLSGFSLHNLRIEYQETNIGNQF